MLTQGEVREYVNNAALFLRGRLLVEWKRVGKISRVQMLGGIVKISAEIREEDQYSHAAAEIQNDRPVKCACTCGMFRRQKIGMCKHVAALLLAYCEEEQDAARRAETERRAAQLREAERLAAVRREVERFEAQQSFLQGLFRADKQNRADGIRLRHEAAGDVRLLPIVVCESGKIHLGLKIGRKKMYVVQSFLDFAQKAAAHGREVYGKELTFSHTEEELHPQDVPLYRYIVSLCRTEKVSQNRVAVSAVQLDSLMRQLNGREVELRSRKLETRARVVEGDVHIRGWLTPRGSNYYLKVMPVDTVSGTAGVYCFDFERSEIRCATGENAKPLLLLMQLFRQYPDGVEMGETLLNEMTRRLLVPAGGSLVMAEGAALLSGHAPMRMSPQFYCDVDGRSRLTCEVQYDYGVLKLRGEEDNPHIRRDALGEEEACLCARRIFPKEEKPGFYAFESEKESEIFDLLSEQLPELRKDGEVLISEKLSKFHLKDRRQVTFGLTPNGTQLLVKADLGGLTEPDLEAAYYAHRAKRRFVVLKDGTFLSGEALVQAAEAEEIARGLNLSAEELAKGANVPLNRAMYLDAALHERKAMELSAPDEIGAFVKRLNNAKEVQAEPPQGLRATLRPYQLSGYHWLCALCDAGFGGILADDMGLGKTLQALALLQREKESGVRLRALVVCPASLQLNWLSEAERFTPDLRCAAMLGTASQRKALIDQLGEESAPEVLLVSYDQLRRDVQAYHGLKFTHVLLDEAQYIKNANSQSAKACKALDAQHRFAMTGTPIENRLSELWSIFDFLMPGYLMNYKKFRERFESPIVQEDDEQTKQNLRLLVAPFILRRMKKDVLTDLPEKVETVLRSEMTPRQRTIYLANEAKLTGELSSGESSAQQRIRILAGILKLRQLCCDPSMCLEGYSDGSGKLEQCVELVHSAVQAGHRILLFSQFTSMLEILKGRLEGEGIGTFMLTGDTGKEQRMDMAVAFNAGEADVFLISLKAGGTGLNLIGADMVIHYDPWWNLAAQNQATDRAFRIGQTKNVQVYKLIASGTIEERIVKLQEAKANLSEGVLEGSEETEGLSEEIVRQLLA